MRLVRNALQVARAAHVGRAAALRPLAIAFIAGAALASACAIGTTEDVGPPPLPTEDASTGRDVYVLPPSDAGTQSETGPSGLDDAGACTRKVVINELKTGGPGANDEFVELYNASACAVPLGGWRLLYRSKTNGLRPGPLVSFAIGDSIPPKTALLFAPAGAPGKKDGELAPGMAASDGQVGLLDDMDTLVDGVGYGTAVGDYVEQTAVASPPAGGSVGRVADGVDSDDNRADFKTFTSATPGVAN